MKEMLKANPTSLNVLSFQAVIRALEKIRDGYALMGNMHDLEVESGTIIDHIYIDTGKQLVLGCILSVSI